MFGSIYKLFRARRDNPLVVYGFPPKRSWIFRALFVLIMVISIAVCAGTLAIYLLSQSTSSSSDSVFMIFFMSYLLTVLCAPLAISLYAFDFRREERLSELYLTRMKPREVLFGSLYWGLFTAAIVIFLCIILHVSAWLLEPVEFRYWAGGWTKTSMSWNGLFFTVYLVLACSVVLKSLQVWLRGAIGRRMIVPITAATAAWQAAALLLLPQVIGMDVFGQVFFPRRFLVLSVVALLVVLFVGYRATTARAAALYYQQIDPEIMIYADWRVRERAAKKLPKALRAAAMKKLRLAARGQWLGSFIYSFLGTAVSLFLTSVILLRSNEYLEEMHYFYFLILCGLLGVCAAGFRLTLSRGGIQAVPMISGMLTRSTKLTFSPIALAQLISYLFIPLMMVDTFIQPGIDVAGMIFLLLTLCAHLLFCYLLWLAVIPRRERPALLLVVTVIIVFLLTACLLAAPGTTNYSVYGYWSAQSGELDPLDYLTGGLLVMIVSILCALPLGLTGLLLQRIHASEVLDHPAGNLSIDPAPAAAGEIIPASSLPISPPELTPGKS